MKLAMKSFLYGFIFLIVGAASSVKAADIIMATSEDIKEFDRLISKEPPLPQNTKAAPNQLLNTVANQNKNFKKPEGQRKEFQEHGSLNPMKPPGGAPHDHEQRPPPPPNLDNRPPPSPNGGPPPQH